MLIMTCSLPPTSLPGTPLRRGLILAHGVSRLVQRTINARFNERKPVRFADCCDPNNSEIQNLLFQKYPEG